MATANSAAPTSGTVERLRFEMALLESARIAQREASMAYVASSVTDTRAALLLEEQRAAYHRQLCRVVTQVDIALTMGTITNIAGVN